jgi:hypothetical protein
MKVIIGDLHFGRKNNSRERHDETMLFFEQFLFPMVDKLLVQHPSAECVCTGDIFDAGQSIDTHVSNDCYTVFERLGQRMPTTAYIGNHDLLARNIREVKHSAKGLKHIPGIRLIESYEEHDGIAYLPFYKLKLEERAFVEQCECDIIFTHTDIEGFYYGGKMIDASPKALPFEIFSKFKMAFNGHIHKKQLKGNVLNVGTPYQMKFTDVDNPCHIHIYNEKTNKVNLVKNNVSPKFKLFHFYQFLDNTVAEARTQVTNNYCRVITPNEIFSAIDVPALTNTIPNTYKEFSFEPLINSDRAQIVSDPDSVDTTVSSVDIGIKYESFIRDSITIGGTIMSEELVNIMLEDFKSRRIKAELRTNINDLDS